MTVYGSGRDQGLTAHRRGDSGRSHGDDTRSLSVVRACSIFAPDVAHALVAAAACPSTGAQVFNLEGSHASMADLVAAIEHVRSGLGRPMMVPLCPRAFVPSCLCAWDGAFVP